MIRWFKKERTPDIPWRAEVKETSRTYIYDYRIINHRNVIVKDGWVSGINKKEARDKVQKIFDEARPDGPSGWERL